MSGGGGAAAAAVHIHTPPPCPIHPWVVWFPVYLQRIGIARGTGRKYWKAMERAMPDEARTRKCKISLVMYERPRRTKEIWPQTFERFVGVDEMAPLSNTNSLFMNDKSCRGSRRARKLELGGGTPGCCCCCLFFVERFLAKARSDCNCSFLEAAVVEASRRHSVGAAAVVIMVREVQLHCTTLAKGCCRSSYKQLLLLLRARGSRCSRRCPR